VHSAETCAFNRKAFSMMSTRRLALSVLCTTSLAAALAAASPAMAQQTDDRGYQACGAADLDYNGTFAGTFDMASGDTITLKFAAPQTAATDWTVEGWGGHGIGTYELTRDGIRWNDSDQVSGPASGVATETYVSTAVRCAEGTSEVEMIKGEVFAPEGSGTVSYPFTVTRTGR
jgi:hypothetical protein